MDIIKRNLMALLRNGAFGEHNETEPMSKFKWDVLHKIAQNHNVDKIVNLALKEDGAETPTDFYSANSLLDIPDAGISKMRNSLLNRRLTAIRQNEPSADDASVETLNMLDIIVQTTENMMTYGLSYANLLKIGMFLRFEGDKVDFVKLDRWLKRLNIARMAQLEGSILITTLGFDKDEVPFVQHVEPQAVRLALQSLDKPLRINVEEWQFHQSASGFVENNSKAMMKTIRNSMKYFFFAPVETTSNFIHRFTSSIANLEE